MVPFSMVSPLVRFCSERLSKRIRDFGQGRSTVEVDMQLSQNRPFIRL